VVCNIKGRRLANRAWYDVRARAKLSLLIGKSMANFVHSRATAADMARSGGARSPAARLLASAPELADAVDWVIGDTGGPSRR
jgi:hypothetical protein